MKNFTAILIPEVYSKYDFLETLKNSKLLTENIVSIINSRNAPQNSYYDECLRSGKKAYCALCVIEPENGTENLSVLVGEMRMSHDRKTLHVIPDTNINKKFSKSWSYTRNNQLPIIKGVFMDFQVPSQEIRDDAKLLSSLDRLTNPRLIFIDGFLKDFREELQTQKNPNVIAQEMMDNGELTVNAVHKNEINKRYEEANSSKSEKDLLKPFLDKNLSRAMEKRMLEMLTHKDAEQWFHTISSFPFDKVSQPEKSLTDVIRCLDEKHYGMEDVKKVLVEEAAYVLSGNSTQRAVCLVGAPGVGKTTIAKSFAESLGLKFSSIACGGMHDETLIRGFNFAWRGAVPGRVFRCFSDAGVMNPVILLDEIDKVSGKVGQGGDVSSAFLEILDRSQNKEFHDNYVGADIDISKALFICTANYPDRIPPELKDRMRLIEVPSYSDAEKVIIGQDYILPLLLEQAGLKDADLGLTKENIEMLVREYTMEPGVRNLEKHLETVVRSAVVKRMLGEDVKGTDQDIRGLFGRPVLLPLNKTEIGRVNGLAVSSLGGSMLTVEVASHPGKGDVMKTGNLLKVMEESVHAAHTAVKNSLRHFGLPEDEMKSKDLHVHFSGSSSQKDGPSAGLAIAVAMLSRLLNEPIGGDVAMTGEVTLDGGVSAVGGIRDKVMGAVRNGVKTVLIPKDNASDGERVMREGHHDVRIIEVSSLKEAYEFIRNGASREPSVQN